MLNGVLKNFLTLTAGTLPLGHISYDGLACGLLDLPSLCSFPTVYTTVVASTLLTSHTFLLFEFLSTFITCVDYLLFGVLLSWWTSPIRRFTHWELFSILWGNWHWIHLVLLLCGHITCDLQIISFVRLILTIRTHYPPFGILFHWWISLIWLSTMRILWYPFEQSWQWIRLVCVAHSMCIPFISFVRLLPTIPAHNRHFSFLLRHEMFQHVFSCLMGSDTFFNTDCRYTPLGHISYGCLECGY